MLRLMPTFACDWTKTGSINNPVKLEVAQQKLFLLVQKESFSLERKCLLMSSPISKTPTILKLSPFMGPNRLLGAIGRTHLLENATFGTKHPVILDAGHPLVRLFLQHLHERHCHHGVEYLKALTQQKFATLKLRNPLNSIRSKLVTCRKRKAETVTPVMDVVTHITRKISF